MYSQFSCCGYFMNNDTVEIGGSFCANQTFVDQLVHDLQVLLVLRARPPHERVRDRRPIRAVATLGEEIGHRRHERVRRFLYVCKGRGESGLAMRSARCCAEPLSAFVEEVGEVQYLVKVVQANEVGVVS